MTEEPIWQWRYWDPARQEWRVTQHYMTEKHAQDWATWLDWPEDQRRVEKVESTMTTLSEQHAKFFSLSQRKWPE